MVDTSLMRAGIPTAEEIIEPSPGSVLRKRIFGNTGLIVGGSVLFIIFFVAVFADFISPERWPT